MGKWKKWSLILTINLCIFLAGTLLLELAFGAWIFREPLDLMAIPRNVDLKLPVDSPYFTNSEAHYKRDEWGFRGPYSQLGEIDILTIGGSTTDQRLLSDGQTWHDVLHRNFEQQGKAVSVVNAGVSGQSTLGNIKNFDVWFPKIPGLRAKYVLVYVGINDMFLPAGEANLEDLAPPDGKLQMGNLVRERSALYMMGRRLKGIYLANKFQLSDTYVDYENGEWVAESAQSDYRETLAGRLESYKHRLGVLVDRIKSFGATPIVVTQARGDYRFEDGQLVGLVAVNGQPLQNGSDETANSDDETTGVDHYLMLSLFNEASLQVCQERGVICYDLGNELRFEIGDFYDYVHNTPQGAEKVGGYLFEKLRDDPRIDL